MIHQIVSSIARVWNYLFPPFMTLYALLLLLYRNRGEEETEQGLRIVCPLK